MTNMKDAMKQAGFRATLQALQDKARTDAKIQKPRWLIRAEKAMERSK